MFRQKNILFLSGFEVNNLKAVGYVNSYKRNEFEKSAEMKIQRDKIQEFCSKNGIELLKIYEEPEESRPDFKPALINLIKDSTGKEFEKVVVIKLDKFGSDDTIKNWIKSELAKYRIDVHSLSESNNGYSSEAANIKASKIKDRVRDIPSLPEVVTKVMELVQNPKSSAAQLSAVIAHDPGLTSRVLRLVNSAYYGFPKQISSIQHAIMILGFTTMRGLVLSSSIFKIFAPKGDRLITLDYKKLWKHSLVTAIAAKMINQYLRLQNDEDIFSAGILHDIGKIILDQYDHENYVKVLSESSTTFGSSLLALEEKHCEISHQEIGYIVAEGWNLPQTLADVLKYHHNPLDCPNNKILTSVIYMGNIFAYFILDFDTIDISAFDPSVTEYLGLNSDEIFQMYSEISEEVQDIGDLESFFK